MVGEKNFKVFSRVSYNKSQLVGKTLWPTIWVIVGTKTKNMLKKPAAGAEKIECVVKKPAAGAKNFKVYQ